MRLPRRRPARFGKAFGGRPPETRDHPDWAAREADGIAGAGETQASSRLESVRFESLPEAP